MSQEKTILQHYHTHWSNKQLGSNNWDTKAKSPGLSEEQIRKARSFFNYLVPEPSEDIENHPIALRYVWMSSNKCLLLCIHSSGKTHDARPRNYFVHTLFLSPECFDKWRPIFYWNSQFWKKRDDTPELHELETFTSLTDEEIPPGLQERDIWEFLDQKDPERKYLYKLLCAVVHKERTRRPIVILDQPDYVAKWIAAVSLLLPLEHCRLLSFSTYNNQEHTSKNMESNLFIIGLSPGTQILPQQYRTYMVFNVGPDQISEVEDSLYALRAKDFAYSHQYHKIKKELFNKLHWGYRNPAFAGQHLDQALLYAVALDGTRKEPLTPIELDSLCIGLAQFESSMTLKSSKDEQDSLRELCDRFMSLRMMGALKGVYMQYYWRTLDLLHQNNRQFASWALFNLLKTQLASDQPLTSEIMEQIRKIFQYEEIASVFTLPKIFDPFRLQNISALSLMFYWQEFGPYLEPERAHIGNFLEISLRAAYPEDGEGRDKESITLANKMLEVMGERIQDWLRFAIQQDGLSLAILLAFYFRIIDTLKHHTLEERVQYRNIIISKFPDVLRSEFKHDIEQEIGRGGNTEKTSTFIDILVKWAMHVKDQKFLFENIFPSALMTIEDGIPSNTPDFKWEDFAKEVLKKELLNKALNLTWKNKFEWMSKLRKPDVQESRATPTTTPSEASHFTSHADELSLEREIQYKHAFVHQELTWDLVKQIQADLLKQEKDNYQKKITSYLHKHFSHDMFISEQHGLVIAGLFVVKYRELFWKEYLDRFKDLLLDPAKAEVVTALLEFWYEKSDILKSYEETKYVKEDFFGKLPELLNSIKVNRKFKQTAEAIQPLIDKKDWYHAIAEYFQPIRKLRFVGAFLEPFLRKS